MKSWTAWGRWIEVSGIACLALAAGGCGGALPPLAPAEAAATPSGPAISACEALAVYAPWDGFPPASHDEREHPQRSLASLALGAVYAEAEVERLEWRLASFGPVTGAGAEDVQALRAALHVQAADLQSFVGMERDAHRLALADAGLSRSLEELRKACEGRRNIETCKSLPDAGDDDWRDRLGALAANAERVRLPALHGPLDRIADIEAWAKPMRVKFDSVMRSLGHAVGTESERIDAVRERLVARCGAPAPKAADRGWIAAPAGTRPRDLVVVVEARSAASTAQRLVRAVVSAKAGPVPASSSTVRDVVLGGFGTGFLLIRGAGSARRAYVVTNRHVVEPGASFRLVDDHGGTLPAAEVVYEDPFADLALLALAEVPSVAGGFVVADQPAKDGEPVTVAGFPGLGHKPTYQITKGAISNERLEVEGELFLQHTAPTDPGSSGSPILDAAGRVVGVASGKARERESTSLAVPRHQLLDALDRALAAERLRDDDGFRRRALVQACLTVVGAVQDGGVVPPSSLSRRLVEETGPSRFAARFAAASAGERDAMRDLALSEPVHALDTAVALDATARLRERGPSAYEMCAAAHQVKGLGSRPVVEVRIPTSSGPTPLSFAFERGRYKLRGF